MPRYLPLISIVVLSLIAWLVYQNMEMYEETVNEGWSLKAAQNPYLAAQYHLEEKGNTAKSVVRIDKEENFSRYDVVFLVNEDYMPLTHQKSRLLAWVKNGGSLIIGAGTDESLHILSDLGFSVEEGYSFDETDGPETIAPVDDADEEKSLGDRLREENEKLKEQFSKQQNDKQDDSKGEEVICASTSYQCDALIEPEVSEEGLTQLMFDNADNPLRINFSEDKILEHAFFSESTNRDREAEKKSTTLSSAPIYWAGSYKGIHFAQLDYGDGLISVLSDTDIWSNGEIAHFDHSYLLDLLVPLGSRLMIVYGKDMPSLGVLIYRNFFEAVVAFGVLIFCFLLYYGRRFGPTYGVVEPPRRSRYQQFSALSQYRWRIKDGEGLLKPIRADILKRAQKRWAGFAHLSRVEKIEYLASLGVLPAGSIEAAMYEDLNFQESRYLTLIHILQHLRKSL